MGFSLKQIRGALSDICVLSGEDEKTYAISKIDEARENIIDALLSLDRLSVAGRNALDALLGCMMSLDSIAGKDE